MLGILECFFSVSLIAHPLTPVTCQSSTIHIAQLLCTEWRGYPPRVFVFLIYTIVVGEFQKGGSTSSEFIHKLCVGLLWVGELFQNYWLLQLQEMFVQPKFECESNFTVRCFIVFIKLWWHLLMFYLNTIYIALVKKLEHQVYTTSLLCCVCVGEGVWGGLIILCEITLVLIRSNKIRWCMYYLRDLNWCIIPL